MEKVKLPKWVCEELDVMLEDLPKRLAIWVIMQNPIKTKEEKEKYYKLMVYAFNNNCEDLAKAILIGYEPEETEEERKEREIKEKMLDYVSNTNNMYLLKTKYIDELYDIAHGKK